MSGTIALNLRPAQLSCKELSINALAFAASISRVQIEIRGIPAPKHKPLAVEDPTLNPVYEPGPELNATAEQSLTLRSRCPSTSCTKGAVWDACILGSVLSLYATDLPSSANAAEHSAAEVSMSMILSIVFF